MSSESNIITPYMEYAVVFPGFQGIFQFKGSLQDFVDDLEEQIAEKSRVVLMPDTETVQVYHVSRGQHLPYTVMTRKKFESYRAQQEILQNMIQGNGIPIR